jgi:uncharacterized membrane protein YdjX (TVP38/TMEM64 family)
MVTITALQDLGTSPRDDGTTTVVTKRSFRLVTGKNQETIIRLIRIAFGVALGVVFYKLALVYATVDCQTIQDSVRGSGHTGALKILLGLIVLSSLGVPAAISGLIAGLIFGPVVGGPFASLAILISSVLLWLIGKQIRNMPWTHSFIEQQMASQAWFQNAMNQHSTSGFHWVASQGIIAKAPLPIFALMIGATVKHLAPASFLAGIFAASVLYIAGYALAGASIGCAVVNHALGLSFDQYKTLTIISCMTLLILSKAQSYVQGKVQS